MSPTCIPFEMVHRNPQLRPAAILLLLGFTSKKIGLICWLNSLCSFSQKSCQVLRDVEVSTDKPLLTTDIGVHAAFAKHHSVVVPQSSDLPETFNQSL